VISHKNMSSRISRNRERLKQLYKAPPAQRKVILRTANPDFINSLCEIALNILQGKIPLTPQQHIKLRRRKKDLRILANKNVLISKKKRLINQTGGFLLPLLSVAIPLFTSLFSRGG
jgi:hypothetical protein